MATPNEKIAASLKELKKLQDRGIIAIHSSELSRTHKERLLMNGFIREVLRGWYIAVPPEEGKGDSTSWFTAFWAFCSRYLENRYGSNYCLSAEQSLLLHVGNTSVPHQLIVRAPEGTNSITNLPFDTSLYIMRSPLPENAQIEIVDGLRLTNLASSLIYSSPILFQKNTAEVRTALLMIRDASDILNILLGKGHSVIAGRLAGAFRNNGQVKIADDILKTMRAVGYDVRETDPFQSQVPFKFNLEDRSPHVNRLRLMWHNMRTVVLEVFPKPKEKAVGNERYLQLIEELYATDAYHSLSIERYRVTPELIERVRQGKWNIESNEKDRQQRDAMAARGYWEAFREVKSSVQRVLADDNPGIVAEEDHGDWYRALFAPSVRAGLLRPADLAGYRVGQVFIGQSKYTPPTKDAVRDLMPVLFELLQEEQEAGVSAVLGHFFFVFIHPYMDGNGRMGRFLMNVMLASGGYPWTIIPVQQRDIYMEALENASVDGDIKPFAEYIGKLVSLPSPEL